MVGAPCERHGEGTSGHLGHWMKRVIVETVATQVPLRLPLVIYDNRRVVAPCLDAPFVRELDMNKSCIPTTHCLYPNTCPYKRRVSRIALVCGQMRCTAFVGEVGQVV